MQLVDTAETYARGVIRPAARPGIWKRGPVLAALALLLGLIMLLHATIPNQRAGNLGSLVETLLPWFGLFIPVLLAGALWRRSATAVVALLLPVVAWLNLFGGLLGDKPHPGGTLTVAEQNVNANNPDPAATARNLAASGADVLALVELAPEVVETYEQELASAYRYHTVQGTVGLWSKLPLSHSQPLDIAMDSTRALRTTVTTDHGPLTVYAAHSGSVRVNPRGGFTTGSRNIGVDALARAVAADPSKRIVLLGDLNGTTDDRAFAGLTAQLRSAQDGFAFTWPAKFPLVRIDHILVRGVEPTGSQVLPANGSDHLPVTAGLTW